MTIPTGVGTAKPFGEAPSMGPTPISNLTEAAQPVVPANPYAPTGWRRKERVEFDIETPSGQLCRVMRFERNDMFRLNLTDYMDTFTPLLITDEMSEEEQRRKIVEVAENGAALGKMFDAVDKVVMSATVRPLVTDDESKINYGTDEDWGNPNFVATVHIDDIAVEDKMYIFGMAFGRSMDDLKSVLGEAPSMGDLPTQQVIPDLTQRAL